VRKASYGGRDGQTGGFVRGVPLAIILVAEPDVVVRPGHPRYEVRRLAGVAGMPWEGGMPCASGRCAWEGGHN
jgi:hypothetical protein